MNRSRKGGRSWQTGGPSRRAIKKAAQPTSSTHKRFSVINSPIERADWLTVSKNSMGNPMPIIRTFKCVLE